MQMWERMQEFCKFDVYRELEVLMGIHGLDPDSPKYRAGFKKLRPFYDWLMYRLEREAIVGMIDHRLTLDKLEERAA